MQVTQLYLYPMKSAQAYAVQQAVVQPQGLSFDRELMLTEADGTFMTARKEPLLYQMAVLPIPGGVLFRLKGEQCVVRYADFQQEAPSVVWQAHFNTLVAEESVNCWFSHWFQRPVQLRWLGMQSQRRLENMQPMSLGDSYPLLLCSQASLAQVQQWSSEAVEMAQFRANIVIDGEQAFEEEAWRTVTIGEVSFEFAQCCTRCVMITRDVQQATLSPSAEPLRTLKQHHTNDRGKPIFGIHLVPINSGVIRVGDVVTVTRTAA